MQPPAHGDVQDKYFDEEREMNAENLDYLPEVPGIVPYFQNKKEIS